MRRLLIPAIIVTAGALLLADLVVANPALEGIAGGLQDYLILLAAGAAVAGAVALGTHHLARIARAGADRPASATVLGGMLIVLGVGLYPGSRGADEPVLRWIVAAVLLPLVAALFSLLFFFMLSAARRGLSLRSREATVIILAAATMLVLLLPVGGPTGAALASAADWALRVPIGAVFRGLLIGVAIATAVAAARLLLAVDGDE